MVWQPTELRRYIKTIGTSSYPALVNTNEGNGYLKAINNPEGKHILVCDWFGTHLAKRLGLPTFEPAIIEVTASDEIPLKNNLLTAPGPSFITKEEIGISMGTYRSLDNVENLQDIPLIIVFDTWVRNCDRYRPKDNVNKVARENLDNLFLSKVGASKGKLILKPIDQGNIFTCGRELTLRLKTIDFIQDQQLYGLFPFLQGNITIEQIVQAADVLRSVSSVLWKDLLASIPEAWEVSDDVKNAIDTFLVQRAHFLVKNMHDITSKVLNPNS